MQAMVRHGIFHYRNAICQTQQLTIQKRLCFTKKEQASQPKINNLKRTSNNNFVSGKLQTK